MDTNSLNNTPKEVLINKLGTYRYWQLPYILKSILSRPTDTYSPYKEAVISFTDDSDVFTYNEIFNNIGSLTYEHNEGSGDINISKTNGGIFNLSKTVVIVDNRKFNHTDFFYLHSPIGTTAQKLEFRQGTQDSRMSGTLRNNTVTIRIYE